MKIILMLIFVLLTFSACGGEDKADENERIPETITGKWIENRGYIYEFGEDGSLLIDTMFHKVSGSYAMNGDRLDISLTDKEGGTEEFCFAAAAEKDGYRLELAAVENERGYCLPYEPAGLMSGFLSAFGGPEEITLVYPDEEPRYAEHSDLIGVWINREYGDITIIDENGITYLEGDEPETRECQIIHGGMIDDDPEYNPYYGDVYTVWDDFYFINNRFSSSPIVFEKYDHPRIDEEFFSGKYEIDTDDISGEAVFEDGKGVLKIHYDEEYEAEISVRGRKTSLTYNGITTEYSERYIVDEYIYLIEGSNYLLLEDTDYHD